MVILALPLERRSSIEFSRRRVKSACLPIVTCCGRDGPKMMLWSLRTPTPGSMARSFRTISSTNCFRQVSCTRISKTYNRPVSFCQTVRTSFQRLSWAWSLSFLGLFGTRLFSDVDFKVPFRNVYHFVGGKVFELLACQIGLKFPDPGQHPLRGVR